MKRRARYELSLIAIAEQALINADIHEQNAADLRGLAKKLLDVVKNDAVLEFKSREEIT